MPAPAPHRCRPQGRRPSLASALLLAASPLILPVCRPVAAAEPPVTYTIQATTLSGLGAMAAGDLSPGGMMRLLMGGSSASSARTLDLTLEASAPVSGSSGAEHRVPAGLGLGPVLSLRSPAAGVDDAPSGIRTERPDGRLLIFRGCAEAAAAVQPEVIRLEALLPDDQALARSLAAMGARRAQNGRRGSGEVVARWPSADDIGGAATGSVPASGSLVGAHTVSGPGTPAFDFSLDSRHDFLAPLQLAITSAGSGWQLRWQPLDGVQGFLAMAAGAGRQQGDLVIWTSSTRPWGDLSLSGLALFSRGTAAADAADVLLPPSQTTCSVSAEARQAMPAAVLTMVAPAAPQRLQAPGQAPAWQVQVERQALVVQPLMEGVSERPADAGEERPGGGGPFNLLKGLF